ncbi:MAG: SNF2 helicase associated domain-containing protein, partial [Oscillospiraceae bacterium]|nr:SNF2 helicase associated domain-containing protein [Oscillospiraceae bacterium]
MAVSEKEQRVHVSAQVRGKQRDFYQTSLDLNRAQDGLHITDYDCTCRAFLDYYGMCKHCVALALQYQQLEAAAEKKELAQARLSSQSRSATSGHLSAALMRYGAGASNQLSAGVRRGSVCLRLNLEPYGFYGSSWSVSGEIGVSRMYVVKDLVELIYNVLHGVDHSYGKYLHFVHAPEMFDEMSQKRLYILEQEVRRCCPEVDSYYFGSTKHRDIDFSDAGLAHLLSLSAGDSIEIHGTSYPVEEGDPPVFLRLRPKGDFGAEVEAPAMREVCAAENGYLLYEGRIYHCSQGFSENALPFFRLIEAAGQRPPRAPVCEYLSQEDYRGFCGNILPRLEPYVDVQTEALDLSKYQPQTPEFSFYLTDEGGVRLRPVVRYGGGEYPLFVTDSGEYRRPELEEPVQALVRRYFSPVDTGKLLEISGEDALYELLKTGLDELRLAGQVYVADSARGLCLRPVPTAHVGVSLAGGLLDVSLEVDDLPPEELSRLLSAYTVKKRYYRLRSGEFLSLESGSLAVLSELSQAIGMEGSTHARVPAFRAQYVNELLTEQDAGIDLRRSTDFKHLIRTLRDYRDSDYPVPETLNASLRGYQKSGFRWLCTLSACGLGGILADDMGLGKTIQTIALLLHLGGTALVVCPASLLYNWQAELQRFAPSLRVQMISGPAASRKTQAESQADVYITSYDLLRRDTQLYSKRVFRCCILDEAQQIRNPATKAAKAAKAIQAEHRFALTGTPISNRL